jgi:hypothetical protein
MPEISNYKKVLAEYDYIFQSCRKYDAEHFKKLIKEYISLDHINSYLCYNYKEDRLFTSIYWSKSFLEKSKEVKVII